MNKKIWILIAAGASALVFYCYQHRAPMSSREILERFRSTQDLAEKIDLANKFRLSMAVNQDFNHKSDGAEEVEEITASQPTSIFLMIQMFSTTRFQVSNCKAEDFQRLRR